MERVKTVENLKQGMVSIYLKQFFDDNFKEVEVKGSLDRFRDLIYIDNVVDITVETINTQNLKTDCNVGTGEKRNQKVKRDFKEGFITKKLKGNY